MAAVAEQLVGRAEEIGAIENAVSGLKAGGPAAIAVIGEPGIGKTRLLSELAALGDESGCIVLSGSGSEFEQDLPFWVFVDALDEYVAGLDPRRLESLEEGVRGDLAGLLPSLSEYAAGEPKRSPGPALPRPPRGGRAASAIGGDEAARARARRRPLGRFHIDRSARRALAPPSRGVRAARRRGTAEADAGAPDGRARARASRGRADTARAAPARTRRGRSAPRRERERGSGGRALPSRAAATRSTSRSSCDRWNAGAARP